MQEIRYDLLLEVSGDLDVNNPEMVSSDAAWEISQLDARWPAKITPSTVIVDDMKLMHCEVTTDIADVETLIKALIIGYEEFTECTIAGLQTAERIVKAVVDEVTGELIEEAKALSIVPCDEAIVFKYLRDTYAAYEEDGTPIGEPLPKSLTQLHHNQREWFRWL